MAKAQSPGEQVLTAIDEAQTPTGLALLRVPFPAHQISKLPKESGKQRDERNADRSKAINCPVCGGWHHKNAVHLDYVGHAALTDRLLDADPQWSWEPLGFTPEGLPALDKDGGLWIKLTVCGVTRFGYGGADGKKGTDATKELIGDALRNAAMRFGAALDLWHKGDLHKDEDNPEKGDEKPAAPKGYAEWLLDFTASADNGLATLMSAFTAAPEDIRTHYTSTVSKEDRDALKEKARKADKKVAA